MPFSYSKVTPPFAIMGPLTQAALSCKRIVEGLSAVAFSPDDSRIGGQQRETPSFNGPPVDQFFPPPATRSRMHNMSVGRDELPDYWR